MDHKITSVLEKRERDLIPRFYAVFACCFCIRSVNTEKLISIVDTNIRGAYREALIHVLEYYKNSILRGVI